MMMMNVGSNKTDHESPDPLVDATSVPAPTAAGKTSGAATGPQSTTLDAKREEGTKNIITGEGIGNGLVGSFAGTLEQPDSSKPTVNGQTTTPSAKSPEAGGGAFVSGSEDTTLKVKLVLSPDDDDDAGDAGDTSTSLSPSTPLSSVTTLTESAKPSLDNSQNGNSLRSSRDSLTSSRPAPPSPAGSRRTSTALSRHSSTRSRPGSITSLTPANNHDAEAATPTTPTPTQSQPPQPPPQEQQQQQQAARRASSSSAVAAPSPASTEMILVKIRDFAFSDEDVRHAGTGPLTPRPNRRLQRPLSTWSASSAGSEQDDGGPSAGGSSYGFTGWGLGRLSWFGARGGTGASAGTGTGDFADGGPSQRDFARNFTDAMSPEYEADDPYESLDDDDDDDDDVDDDRGRFGRGEENRGEDRPLLPGLYRALYVFEPEGTAEMALEEDQVVRVIGRGGGVGWAIVARGGDEGHALVPEGYLELVSLDRDSEQVGEEDG